jgi:hypothetical protein
MKRNEKGKDAVLPFKGASVINIIPVRPPNIRKLIIINELSTCRTRSISILYLSLI